MNENIKVHELEPDKNDAKDSEAVWDQYINEDIPQDIDKEVLQSSDNEKFKDEEDKIKQYESEDVFIAPEQEDIIDPVNLKLDDIQNQLNNIQKDFAQKLKFDLHKNQIIDNLHQELQAYKNDILKKYLQPTIMDIIQFIDNIRKLIKFYTQQEPSEHDPEKLLKLLESIPSDLEDICVRQGINSFTCHEKNFDPSRQRVLKRVETNNEAEDKTVAESLHPGYEWDGKIIRPEMVTVYHYQAPTVEAEEMRNSDE